MARDVVKKMFSLDDQSMTDDTSKSSEDPKLVTLEVDLLFSLLVVSVSYAEPRIFSLRVCQRQERLKTFYMVHDPDQAQSAGEIASMFGGDLSGLQEVLYKKYGAKLSSSQMSSTDLVQTSGGEVQSLIDTIEATVLGAGTDNAIDDAFQLHLSSLGTIVIADVSITLSKPASSTTDDEIGASDTVTTHIPGADASEFEEGMLDLIREKTEAIARALPLRHIPLDFLLLALRNEEGREQRVDSKALDVPLLHAVLTECSVLNTLMDTVHATIEQVDMALQRNSLLGGNVHQARASARCLVAGQVPLQWIKDSYPTTKPLAQWLRELTKVRLPQVAADSFPSDSFYCLSRI